MDEHLPISESTFFILLSLAREPRHGYAIMKDVETLSRERITLSTGTLYGALSRLLDQGWIARADDAAEQGNTRARKSYRLTHLGERILQAETERMEQLASAARLRLAEETS